MDNPGYAGDGDGEISRADAPGRRARLPRTVGAFSGAAIIVGTMIGSGIFVSPKSVLERSGSVALSLLVWLGCGVLSALGALCYIELGLLVPKSGGEFAYLFHGLGPLQRFLGPLSAFLFMWTFILISRPASTAILSLACAEYCIRPFFTAGCDPPPMATTLLAVVICCLVTFINCYSTTLSTRVQNVFTITKLAAIAIIVVGGAYSLWQGNSQHLVTGFEGSTTSPSDIAKAFYSGLWAYDGWNNLNFITEEIVNPAKNLPLAVVTSLSVVTICYILTNVAYLTVLSPQQLLDSPIVAVSFAQRLLGPAAWLIPLGVAVSVLGALNGTVLSTARVGFAAARHGHCVAVASFIHAYSLTPVATLAINAVVTVAMITGGNIGDLIDFFSFSAWIFYGLVMVTLLVMRRTRPDAARPVAVPIAVPWLVLAMAAYLVVAPIVQSPQIEHAYVLAFLAIGVLVYTSCVYCRWTPPGISFVTMWLQKSLLLVPTVHMAE